MTRSTFLTVARLACLAAALSVLTSTRAVAKDPPAAVEKFAVPDPRPSTLTRQTIAKTGEEFRRCLEANRELHVAKKAYTQGAGPLQDLLQAQQELTAAQIHYAATSTNVRGYPALREYLSRRGEVAALEEGLKALRELEVAEAEREQYRQEVDRYAAALKQAEKDLTIAERTWKTADRANQFRYLNRRALSPK